MSVVWLYGHSVDIHLPGGREHFDTLVWWLARRWNPNPMPRFRFFTWRGWL